MASFTQTVNEVPLGGLLVLLAVLVSGLIVWAAGRRLLRFALAVVGLALGAMIGWTVGSAFALGVPPVVAAVIGGLLLACIAILSERILIPLAMAAVCAAAAPLVVWGAVDSGLVAAEDVAIAGEPDAPGEAGGSAENFPADAPNDAAPPDDLSEIDRATQAMEQWIRDILREKTEEGALAAADDALSDTAGAWGVELDADSEAVGTEGRSAADEGAAHDPDANGFADDLPEVAQQGLDEAKGLYERLRAAAANLWGQTPEVLRVTLIVAGIVGMLAGLLVGLLARRVSAAFITAFGGSLLWLASGRVLLERVHVPTDGWLPGTARTWLALWMVAAIIGLGVQWTLRPRPADTK